MVISDLVISARDQLDPLMCEVVAELEAADNAYPLAFFTQILMTLRSTTVEEELMELFFRLSTTAFQGFVFSPPETQRVDELLESCEQIALTLSVGGSAH